MKNAIRFLTLGIFVSLLSVSCSDDDDAVQPIDQNITVQALTNTLINHNDWYLAEYSEEGVDHLPDYDMFDFEFASNGDLFATYNADTASGGWTVYAADAIENPNTPAVLQIAFADPDLVPLTGHWFALTRTGNQVRLQRINDLDQPLNSFITFVRD